MFQSLALDFKGIFLCQFRIDRFLTLQYRRANNKSWCKCFLPIYEIFNHCLIAFFYFVFSSGNYRVSWLVHLILRWFHLFNYWRNNNRCRPTDSVVATVNIEWTYLEWENNKTTAHERASGEKLRKVTFCVNYFRPMILSGSLRRDNAADRLLSVIRSLFACQISERIEL